MAHRTPAPLRTLGALVRALLGLALLTALVAGTPYVLLHVGTQPTELSGGLDVLLRPDDGTLFFTALTCIGWAAWAAFTWTVILEIIAVARRRSAPRLPGLGGMQSLASFLVGGIVLLAPTAASATTSTPAVAVTQTVADSSVSATPTPTSTPTLGTDYPTHTVTSATETPWDLAEEYLGNGQRWRDIAALNPDIPGLASGDQYLPGNAVVKLPLDARPTTPAAQPSATTAPPAADSRSAAGPAEHTDGEGETASTTAASGDRHAPLHDEVTVAPGDSLWEIADNQYGDPTAWRDIYEANEGEVQPGGRHFDDPDLILPGQRLDMPKTGEDAASPAEPTTRQDDTSPDRTAPSGDDQDSEHGQQQAPVTTPAPSASPTTDPSATAPRSQAPSDNATPAQTPAPAAQPSQDSTSPVSPVMAWTATGFVAAALVGTLAVRRRRQQHRRRPGRRIAMPTGRAAATEQGLRSVQTPTGFDLLNAALRCLAHNLQAAGRELPALTAAVLHENRLELHLAEDTPPSAPFTAAAGRQDLWTCSAGHPQLADEDALDGVAAPYPALVSIGWDPQGHYVLVDLEHIGLLHLDGDADFARHVLQAIAVELANTPVAGHLEVTALDHSVPGLEHAVPERVARATDIDAATTELTAHAHDQRNALTALGARSPRTVRLRDEAGGDWTPHILLAEHLPDEPATDNLLAALTAEPRTASAIITASTPASLPAEVWTLTCQGPSDTAVLPHSGLPVRLQALDDDRFRDAIELLTTADTDTDIPADAEPIEDETGLDGLPDEYATLEKEGIGAEAPAGPAKAPETRPKDPTATASSDEDMGESLADVLALDEENAGPVEAAAPAGTVGVVLALAQPGARPASVIHVPIPAPTETPADRADTEAPSGESLADVMASPGPDDKTPVPPAPARTNPRRPLTGSDLPQNGSSGAEADPAKSPLENPSILILGPLTVAGAKGRVDSNRKIVATELLAFLALHPGSDHHAVDAALWPASRVNKEMRNAAISRARSWLGTDTDGNQHLPRVQNTPDKRYRLGPNVNCDWITFQRHARQGLADASEDGDLSLRRALALLRGRPFAGMDPQRYAWAEPTIQEMISAITDVASELSIRRRESGDTAGALWAARQGLLAVEESETLHRALFLAHHAAGDTEALRSAAAHLRQINDSIGGGVEMEPDTAELLRNLLPYAVHSSRTR